MALVGKNRHDEAERIQRRHFNSTAKRFGYGETAEPLLQELIGRTSAVIDQVQRELPAGYSQEVADKVLGGLQGAARALEGMPPSWGPGAIIPAFSANWERICAAVNTQRRPAHPQRIPSFRVHRPGS